MTLPAVQRLQVLADNPALTPEDRAALRGVIRQLAHARDVACRWGYDDNAGLRVKVFKDATATPEPIGSHRIALGLALDELCRAVGVPLEGSARRDEAC